MRDADHLLLLDAVVGDVGPLGSFHVLGIILATFVAGLAGSRGTAGASLWVIILVPLGFAVTKLAILPTVWRRRSRTGPRQEESVHHLVIFCLTVHVAEEVPGDLRDVPVDGSQLLPGLGVDEPVVGSGLEGGAARLRSPGDTNNSIVLEKDAGLGRWDTA